MGRIYLSPPDVDESSRDALLRAFDGGWIAPLGPEVDGFERELAEASGRTEGVALSSGTAGLHLALVVAGIGPGDHVAVQSLTFVATANAVMYTGATPVFIDSEATSWNLDPDLLAESCKRYADAGNPIRAAIAVDLYGQCADYERISQICAEHDVFLIEDAAEALGATYQGRPAGSFGDIAALSFNGNKIITTSGGGALVTDDVAAAAQYRFLATQARDPAPHYQHSTLGYNYRMSNLLAALGRAQLTDLERRVERRRSHNAFYRSALSAIPGVSFMPEPEDRRSTSWLTVFTIDPALCRADRESVRLHLESLDIEARPVWKPMHLQPFYRDADMVGGAVADVVFRNGLCIPSGSTLTDGQREMIVEEIHSVIG